MHSEDLEYRPARVLVLEQEMSPLTFSGKDSWLSAFSYDLWPVSDLFLMTEHVPTLLNACIQVYKMIGPVLRGF